MKTLLINGTIIDPSQKLEGKGYLRIEDNKITECALGEAPAPQKDENAIDVKGAYVTPGFIDLHVHLREPGQESKSRSHPEKFPCKRKFYADLLALLKKEYKPSDNILIVGDMNVAPNDKDIGIGEQNAKRWLKTGKCSFLPEEREWVQALVDWGTIELYREKYPDSTKLSWFDYRSGGFESEPKHGLRIDLLLGTKSVLKHCVSIEIDHEIRGMEKPSDHCPIIAEFR